MDIFAVRRGYTADTRIIEKPNRVFAKPHYSHPLTPPELDHYPTNRPCSPHASRGQADGNIISRPDSLGRHCQPNRVPGNLGRKYTQSHLYGFFKGMEHDYGGYSRRHPSGLLLTPQTAKLAYFLWIGASRDQERDPSYPSNRTTTGW